MLSYLQSVRAATLAEEPEPSASAITTLTLVDTVRPVRSTDR